MNCIYSKNHLLNKNESANIKSQVIKKNIYTRRT